MNFQIDIATWLDRDGLFGGGLYQKSTLRFDQIAEERGLLIWVFRFVLYVVFVEATVWGSN